MHFSAEKQCSRAGIKPYISSLCEILGGIRMLSSVLISVKSV